MTARRRSAQFARRLARRARKYGAQRLHAGESASSILWVVGCQRSGTTMLLDVLDESPDSWVYHEHNRRAFRNWRLRPLPVRERLVRRARARWLVFKPLFDSQNVDQLFAEHPSSKTIWVLRRYRDVVESSVRKWGARLQLAIRRLATEEDCDHWMADRMSRSRRKLLKDLYHDEMSVHTAAALRWYLRNEIYFDLDLPNRRARALLVRYEDLVENPPRAFASVFAFLDLDFHESYVAGVAAPARRRQALAEIDPAVEELCEDLAARLVASAEPAS
ncbi:MAG: sulfotransferase [Myxococcota bacterium]